MSETNTPETFGTGDEDVGAATALFERMLAAPETDTPEEQEQNAAKAAEPDAVEATADDEAATQEADADAESEGEPDDSQTETKEPDDGIKVRLDAETEVTLAELKKGYLRQSDYTRKTTDLAENRRQFEAQAAQLNQHLVTRLQATEALLGKTMPPPPDPALEDVDPIEYMRQERAYNRRVAEIRQVMAEHQAAQQRVAAEGQQKQRQYVEAEFQRLIEARPDLKSPETQKAFREEMLEAGRTYGFSDQEMAAISDHRLFLALQDARKYRALQTKKPAVQEKAKAAPVPVKPGPRASVAEQRASVTRDRMQALRSSGRVEDAAGIFEQMLRNR
jgi:hypothetical protein